MPKALPHVAASDITADFVPLHDWLDTVLPRFRKSALGQALANVAARRHDVSGRAYEVYCPFDRDLLVARLVSADRKAVKAGRSKGRIVHGGERLAGGLLAKGNFVTRQWVAELPSDHWINVQELFLPFLSVQACVSLDEGIALGNRNVYGLCAGLYSEDPKEMERFLGLAEAGVLSVNRRSGATRGAWPRIQSFCGWKGSGVDAKVGLGPYTIPRYIREQSLTIMRG